MITNRASLLLTPRDKVLQRIVILCSHLQSLLSIEPDNEITKAVQDTAEGYIPTDLSEKLWDTLNALYTNNPSKFYRLVNKADDALCVELRAWWEKKYKERAALRRAASNRRNNSIMSKERK